MDDYSHASCEDTPKDDEDLIFRKISKHEKWSLTRLVLRKLIVRDGGKNNIRDV